MQKQIYGLDVRENKIKAEAYKEFAEKLKCMKKWNVDLPDFVFVSDIDNLLKEMVGEEE